MSSLKNIQSKMEQIEKLKNEVEKAKNEINTTFGKKLIESLELDYELLSSKKDINTLVNKIVENLPSDSLKESTEVRYNNEHDKEYSEVNTELQSF